MINFKAGLERQELYLLRTSFAERIQESTGHHSPSHSVITARIKHPHPDSSHAPRTATPFHVGSCASPGTG
ncbi:hypothetical protein E2C01_076162 [Portunus trituberculatus]|uniref:Uncharacterized protein n=1 Tax=Portunus trituberculatus TaxID=210409 RepID=A0A5B7IAP8_PORTR|nr:hypothetical protein [Portunus trituberculatus]